MEVPFNTIYPAKGPWIYSHFPDLDSYFKTFYTLCVCMSVYTDVHMGEGRVLMLGHQAWQQAI